VATHRNSWTKEVERKHVWRPTRCRRACSFSKREMQRQAGDEAPRMSGRVTSRMRVSDRRRDPRQPRWSALTPTGQMSDTMLQKASPEKMPSVNVTQDGLKWTSLRITDSPQAFYRAGRTFDRTKEEYAAHARHCPIERAQLRAQIASPAPPVASATTALSRRPESHIVEKGHTKSAVRGRRDKSERSSGSVMRATK